MPDGIRVKRPDGKTGRIPAEDLPAALREGYTVIRDAEPTSPIPKDYGFNVRNMLSGALQGAKNILVGIPTEVGGALLDSVNPQTTMQKFGPGGALLERFVVDPAIEQFKKAAREEDPIARFGSGLGASIPLVGPWAAGLGEQMGTGDIGGALSRGTTEAGLLGAAAKTPAMIRRGRNAVSTAIRTPTGEVRPVTDIVRKSVADRLFPETEIHKQTRLAEDLMRREKQQEALNRKAEAEARKEAAAQRAQERIRLAREKAEAAKQIAEMKKAGLEEQARAENARMGRSNPDMRAPQLPTITRTELVEDPFAGRSNPDFKVSQLPVIRRPEAGAAGGESLIVDPSAPFRSRVTLQSLAWEDLSALARQGDRLAIQEVIRRGREAEIPNLRYIMERGQTAAYPPLRD